MFFINLTNKHPFNSVFPLYLHIWYANEKFVFWHITLYCTLKTSSLSTGRFLLAGIIIIHEKQTYSKKLDISWTSLQINAKKWDVTPRTILLVQRQKCYTKDKIKISAYKKEMITYFHRITYDRMHLTINVIKVHDIAPQNPII
jgi:hypothetical protein